uniref:Uncharacterized protein n=1 Tax=Arundo donax TaxID=35708 RepID=A0A0A9FMJ3_ARUDO
MHAWGHHRTAPLTQNTLPPSCQNSKGSLLVAHHQQNQSGQTGTSHWLSHSVLLFHHQASLVQHSGCETGAPAGSIQSYRIR